MIIMIIMIIITTTTIIIIIVIIIMKSNVRHRAAIVTVSFTVLLYQAYRSH